MVYGAFHSRNTKVEDLESTNIGQPARQKIAEIIISKAKNAKSS
jgi:hypothetical protein